MRSTGNNERVIGPSWRLVALLVVLLVVHIAGVHLSAAAVSGAPAFAAPLAHHDTPVHQPVAGSESGAADCEMPGVVSLRPASWATVGDLPPRDPPIVPVRHPVAGSAGALVPTRLPGPDRQALLQRFRL